MDVFSHAVWGRHLTHHRIDWKLAALMGVLPDLVAFIPASISLWISGKERVSVDDSTITADFPAIAWEIYSISHSLFWSGLLFLVIWFGLTKMVDKEGMVRTNRFIYAKMDPRSCAFFLMAPWFFHILIDIPSHTAKFFPTPFLYPLSEFVVDGVRWSTPWIWFTNLAGIIIVAIILYRIDHKRS